jgi:Pyridine nucleotide-disulphide oxidoreductase
VNNSADPLVCIVGAGPYGVSIAACLQHFGINFRIFGNSMHRWLSQMPERMILKSESCASSLFEPTGRHTLEQYCREKRLPFPKYGTPVPRQLFVQYALDFQRTLVPDVEQVTVTSIDKLPEGFALELSSGETLKADKVIVATGLDGMAHIPEQLAQLPLELRSHCAEHYEFNAFKNKEVIVVGRGQSALETAAILQEDGASAHLSVRKPGIFWNPLPTTVRRSLYQRWRRPRNKYGDGLRPWAYDNLAGLFRYLPQQTRLKTVKTALGPAGAWWLKERVVGRLPISLNQRILGAETRGGRVALQVVDQNGQKRELVADHVIAGTGYQFDLRKLPFLRDKLKTHLLHEQQSPILSAHFESSVPGLYFAGLSGANSFGPAMRFIAGVPHPARRISLHLASGRRLSPRPFVQPEKCPED